jgi:hypothetical protein
VIARERQRSLDLPVLMWLLDGFFCRMWLPKQKKTLYSQLCESFRRHSALPAEDQDFSPLLN